MGLPRFKRRRTVLPRFKRRRTVLPRFKRRLKWGYQLVKKMISCKVIFKRLNYDLRQRAVVKAKSYFPVFLNIELIFLYSLDSFY